MFSKNITRCYERMMTWTMSYFSTLMRRLCGSHRAHPYTMAPKGSTNIPLVGEEDKRCFSALITSTAEGKLLRGTLVWKGTTDRCHVTEERNSTTIHQVHTKNKWSNVEVTCMHIKECILPEIASICLPKEGFVPSKGSDYPASVLLLDSWKSHWNESVVEVCNEHNIRMRKIPPNFTNRFQPNDQYINAVLKSKLTKCFNNHIWHIATLVTSDISAKPDLSLTYLKPLFLAWLDFSIKGTSKAVIRSSWGRATGHIRPRTDIFSPKIVIATWPGCDCLLHHANPRDASHVSTTPVLQGLHLHAASGSRSTLPECPEAKERSTTQHTCSCSKGKGPPTKG